MKDEGVIKFNCSWIEGPLPPGMHCSALLDTRNELYRQKLIGYDEAAQVGYGNISVRLGESNTFLISGTQTGHIALLSESQLSCVQQADIDTNTVYCTGPAKASSESLTHAAIYQSIPSAHAVIHVHHKALWQYLLHHAPATAPNIGYGTTGMAGEINRLIGTTSLLTHKVIAMTGHEEGVIIFGETLDEAYAALMKEMEKVKRAGQ